MIWLQNLIRDNQTFFLDSMISQLSKWMIKDDQLSRFRCNTWGVKLNGKEAVDVSGVTNQTITIAVNSFLSQQAHLCNPRNEDENIKSDEILVIPYPSKVDESTQNISYAFGQVLGAILRKGTVQCIPFPLFI